MTELTFLFFATLSCFFATLAGGGAGLILLPCLILLGLPYPNALACHKITVMFLGVGSGSKFIKAKVLNYQLLIFCI